MEGKWMDYYKKINQRACHLNYYSLHCLSSSLKLLTATSSSSFVHAHPPPSSSSHFSILSKIYQSAMSYLYPPLSPPEVQFTNHRCKYNYILLQYYSITNYLLFMFMGKMLTK